LQAYVDVAKRPPELRDAVVKEWPGKSLGNLGWDRSRAWRDEPRLQGPRLVESPRNFLHVSIVGDRVRTDKAALYLLVGKVRLAASRKRAEMSKEPLI
jgi:hypothetical protein